jgi:hypothetical protein
MAKIKLIRSNNTVEDVRVPYILTISRVPCVGELIIDMECNPGYYKVLHVKHYTNTKSKDALVAEVDVDYVNT